MGSERTLTETARGSEARPELAPALVVAWHPDAARIGARRRLRPGVALELGRGSDALGPGLLDDPRLSARHCRIEATADSVHVHDLGSRNGTHVQGRSVAQAELHDGAVLAIGRLLFVLLWAPLHWTTSDGPLVSRSPAMGALLDRIAKVAPLDSAVLVRGPTGTGKELVARRLHELSGRRGPLVAVNCGAIDQNLLHSELFGHTRGAFSGADGARRGLFEAASGGTLLLDEIGEASPALQASLLRVLQEGEVRPVGSNETRRVDVRVVAATHRLLQPPDFREDLLARLQRWELEVPALAARRLDILPLALEAARQVAGGPVVLHHHLAHHLLLRDWPRNVRELQAAVEQAVVLAAGEQPVPLPAEWTDEPPPPTPRDERPTPEALRQHLLDGGLVLKRVAARLGIGRSTLYRWIDEAGIDLEALRTDA